MQGKNGCGDKGGKGKGKVGNQGGKGKGNGKGELLDQSHKKVLVVRMQTGCATVASDA